MNLWHELPPGPDWPTVIYVVVEIPKKSRNKYEYDEQGGFVKLDRVLFSSLHYPGDYGFVPRTLADDGDPLDVLVLCSEILDPLTEVDCYPIGAVRMIDNEQVDEKIIAIPFKDPTYIGYQDISGLPRHTIDEVSHFFDVYKALEHSKTSVKETCSREEALRILAKSIQRYVDVYGQHDEAH